MKNHLRRNTISLLALLALIALLLTACGQASTAAQATSSAGEVSPSQAQAQPVTAAPCFIGTWNLTDFSSYMQSIEQKASTGSDISIASKDFMGSVVFTFKNDDTAQMDASKFTQSFTLTTTAAGQKLDVPIILTIDGTSKARYTVQGDQLSFSAQDNSALTITIDAMGNTSTVDEGLFGKADTAQLEQFACPDANTLTLKILSAGLDLAPLTLTRSQ